jgi:hypothetical protein
MMFPEARLLEHRTQDDFGAVERAIERTEKMLAVEGDG